MAISAKSVHLFKYCINKINKSLVVLEFTQCVVKMTSSNDISSRRIQKLLEAYFKIKSQW